MKVKFNGELRNVAEKPYEFNGNKGLSYSITLEVEEGSFYMKTTKEVFELYKQGYLEKGQQCEFTADYSPMYKSFRVTQVA